MLRVDNALRPSRASALGVLWILWVAPGLAAAQTEAAPPPPPPPPPVAPAPSSTPPPGAAEDTPQADATEGSAPAEPAAEPTTAGSPPADEARPTEAPAQPTAEPAGPAPAEPAAPPTQPAPDAGAAETARTVGALLDRAAEALEGGALAEAQSLLEQALAADGEDVEVLAALALVHLQTRQPHLAAGYLERLLQLDPYDDRARLDLATAHWQAGAQEPALEAVRAVLARHPQMPDALALQELIETGASPDPSPWQPVVRAGATVLYDSNLALVNQALPTATGVEAASVAVEVDGGVTYATEERPLTVMGHLAVQTSLAGNAANRDDLERFMTSSVGLNVTGRLTLGPVLSALDVRYRELFTATFRNHHGRLISPTASAGIDLAPGHRLSLLVGVPVRMPVLLADTGAGTLSIEGETNVTVTETLRYQGRLGILDLIVDAGARHNVDTSEDDPAGANTGFHDGGGTIYLQAAPLDALVLFALGDGRGRVLEGGVVESSWVAQAGARFTVGDYFELHATYSFTATVGDDENREFTRHQVGGGVRAWFP